MSDSEDNSPDLSTINWRNGKSSGFNPTTEAPKVDELDLLTSIQTAKNLSDLKEHYRKKKEIEVLEAPLSQLDQARIDREIAFEKTKKDLDQWQHIVNEGRVNRLVIKPKVPEGDVEFKPRTELEKQMDEVLKKSRKTRSTDDNIASAEEEILKAMNFEVARENFLKLQTMRRQMGYQEAKFRRQAKIKSKTYHRIKKRQERRTVLKEFEELVAKDPDAAKAKLDMLETDRIFERAELRHRGQNKWSKELRQYASKNPEIEKTLADHLHYHRELKQKYGKGAFSSSEDEEDEPRKLGLEDVMKLAADEASNATSQIMPEIETVAKNPWLSDELTRLRNTKANIANKMILKESVPEKPEFEVDPEFSTSLVSIVKEQTQAEIKAKVEAATKKNILDAERICNSTVFDNLNDPLYEYDGIDEQKTDSEDDKLLDKKKNKMREKKKRQRERRIIRKEKEKKREAHFEKVEEAKKKKDEKRKMAKEAMKKSKEKKGKKGVNVKDGEENEINGENNGKKDLSEKNEINGENNGKKDVGKKNRIRKNKKKEVENDGKIKKEVTISRRKYDEMVNHDKLVKERNAIRLKNMNNMGRLYKRFILGDLHDVPEDPDFVVLNDLLMKNDDELKNEKVLRDEKTRKRDKPMEIGEVFNEIDEKIRKFKEDDGKPLLKKNKNVVAVRSANFEKVKKPMESVKKSVETIDLKTFLEVSDIATNELPENINDCLVEGDEEVDREKLLAEAFADDDIVDFEEDKKRVEDEEDPIKKEEDITQLGWGSWAGFGIETKEKPKEIKRPRRKDGKKSHVISRKTANNSIVELQPKSVPWPYVEAPIYEAVMRQPIGRDWNPLKVTAQMTQPQVQTQAGKIIRPLSKRDLLQAEALKKTNDQVMTEAECEKQVTDEMRKLQRKQQKRFEREDMKEAERIEKFIREFREI